MQFLLMKALLTVMLGGSGGGGGSMICCHHAPDGNLICTLPVAGECQSGDKVVVCRYGVWSNEDGTYAECNPKP